MAAGLTQPVNQVFLFDRQNRALLPVSATRDGLAGTNASFGGVVSADGRYVAFRSQASNLLGETAPAVSQILLWDRARFQPDALVRREGRAPGRGAAVLAPVAQAVEQTVLPGGSRVFSVTVRNDGQFTDEVIVRGSSGEPEAWDVSYFTGDTSREVTARVTGAGARLGPLRAGEALELRVLVRQLTPQATPKHVRIGVVSLADPLRADAVEPVAEHVVEMAVGFRYSSA